MADVQQNEERIAFDELRRRMKGVMEEELYEDENIFRRFLKARDYNVDNSEQMLKQHLEWRRKYDLKNILKYQPLEVLQKYFILTKLGYDKEGRIVKYNHFSSTDYRGIFESCKTDEWYKCLILYFEKDMFDLKYQSEKLGRHENKVVYIVNVENFTLSKATDKKVLTNIVTSINMYLNNYPETLKTVYAINAPFYFHIFFSMMKPFLPNTVIKKIQIYSDDSWKSDLLEAIDAEVLPAFLGGTRTDPDGNPLCLTLIKNPGNVPKHYYMSTTKQVFVASPETQKITVSKAAKQDICLEVKEAGSYLEWEFQVKSGDIKFGINLKNNKGEKTEVIPLQRLNSDESTVNGLYICEKPGTYIIIFDNSYSFFKSKEIYYKLKITNPSKETD